MANKKQLILKELHSFNNIIRGFCERFDCEDIPCTECPVGPDICYVIGKDNLEKKYGIQSKLHRFVNEYWKDIFIVVTLIGTIGGILHWW